MTERNQIASADETLTSIAENGNYALLPAAKNRFPAKSISDEELVAEEKKLRRQEETVEKSYEGWRGWLRLFRVSQVIGMLSLYLYLDQYDMHHRQHRKVAAFRMEQAKKLNFFAVLGEYLRESGRGWFDFFMRVLRWFVLRGEKNKERRQERQA